MNVVEELNSLELFTELDAHKKVAGKGMLLFNRKIDKWKLGLIRVVTNESLYPNITQFPNLIEIPWKLKRQVFGKKTPAQEFNKMMSPYLMETKHGNPFIGRSNFAITPRLKEIMNEIPLSHFHQMKSTESEGNFNAGLTSESIESALKKEKQTTFIDRWNASVLIGNFDYHEDASGRLHTPAQRITKETKELLFKGYYDYDINSSAPTLFILEFKEITGNADHESVKTIEDFLKNKEYYRIQFARKFGISLSESKEILTQIFLGAKIPTQAQLSARFDENGEREFDFYLQRTVGRTKALAIRQDEWYSKLVDAVNVVTETIYQYHKKNAKEFNQSSKTIEINNDYGMTLKLNRWNKSKVLYHIYVGKERRILEVFKQFALPECSLLVHDGFLSKTDISLSSIESAIERETGLIVTLKKRKVGTAFIND